MRTTTLTWDGSWSAELDEVARKFGGDRTVVLVFADRTVSQRPLDELDHAFSGSTITGCSTAGQILDSDLAEEPLVALVLKLERHRPALATIEIDSAESCRDAGVRLAGLLPAQPADAAGAVLVFSDGLNVNGSELVEGLRARLPAGTSISGGLAGDAADFGSTWVLSGASRMERAVTALSLPGVEATHGTGGGWEGFGPHRRVTRSAGNVLAELDDQPALALYREYLGDLAAGLPGSALMFPLALESGTGAPPVVRTVLAVDEEAQTMTFAGEIPLGATVRLMRTTMDRLVDGAAEAGRQSAQTGGNSVSIAVSCVGRRLVLGERTWEELEAVAESLGATDRLVGFYSYGEISSSGGFTCLHNQTMTITTIRESAAAQEATGG
jgi:hypothetical protein